MHEWMVDNDNTPHIVVDASADGVVVPVEHVKDGKIILNISDTAAHNLKLGNTAVSFRARFGGVPFDVWVPMRSIMGIYARETGQGMIFSHDSDAVGSTRSDEPGLTSAPADDDLESTRARSHLRVIK
jgi:stringent starvation protein B